MRVRKMCVYAMDNGKGNIPVRLQRGDLAKGVILLGAGFAIV